MSSISGESIGELQHSDYVELSVSNIVSPSNPSVVVSGSVRFECMGCLQGVSAGGWTWVLKVVEQSVDRGIMWPRISHAPPGCVEFGRHGRF